METTEALDRLLTVEVRKAMTASGMSINGLAEETGIPYATLYRRINAVGAGFSVSELVAIARVLGTSFAELAARAETEQAKAA